MLCNCLVDKATKELNPSGLSYLASALQPNGRDPAIGRSQLAYSQAMRASRLLANGPGQCALEDTLERKGDLAGY